MPKSFRLGIAAAGIALCLAQQVSAGQPVFTVDRNGAIHDIVAEDFGKIGLTVIETAVLTLGNGKHSVKGVLARDLMKYLGASGETMKITALDGYAMDVPVADIMDYDAVVATEIDGKTLSVRDKGPAWLIYPVSQHRELVGPVYEARSVWQIKSITFN